VIILDHRYLKKDIYSYREIQKIMNKPEGSKKECRKQCGGEFGRDNAPFLKDFFGKVKNWKKSTQQIKDELRNELYD